MYGPVLEIEWILIIHNNCIFPYYGHSIKIVWTYYRFSGAIANFIVWSSLFLQCTIKIISFYPHIFLANMHMYFWIYLRFTTFKTRN